MRKTIEEAASEYLADAFISEGCVCFQDVTDAFENGASYALSHQWRSVEEELPEQCTTVLCVNANVDPYCQQCWVSEYIGGKFIDKEDSKPTFPTHWLPIPSINPEQL